MPPRGSCVVPAIEAATACRTLQAKKIAQKNWKGIFYCAICTFLLSTKAVVVPHRRRVDWPAALSEHRSRSAHHGPRMPCFRTSLASRPLAERAHDAFDLHPPVG